jgi:hypothetical protein
VPHAGQGGGRRRGAARRRRRRWRSAERHADARGV